ncbi:MAG TPA: hypothetical protein VJV78_39675 [Polyangiales bacterium]|nr:hypothetical protein [Polyangiales bacterium]
MAHPRRTPLSLLIGLALGLACATNGQQASAQELTTEGNLVFGAERLFGFYLDKRTREANNNVDVDFDQAVVGVGWGLVPGFGLLNMPRLGIDYFLNEHLSLGGSFGLASVGGENESSLGILFAARVGYALRLTHAIAFWPRGGISFATVNGGLIDASVFAFSLEGMFSFAPSSGWSFLAGPLLDIGFTGEWQDQDYSEILFGLMFGIEGHIDL